MDDSAVAHRIGEAQRRRSVVADHLHLGAGHQLIELGLPDRRQGGEVAELAHQRGTGAAEGEALDQGLQLFQPSAGNGQALRYGIGVGRDGFRWSGIHRVSAKKEWPDWTPPAEMLARRRDLPRHMAGGIENPLGARALYLGSTLYRIHGSNEPETIGQAVSSGCFRMTNEDVTDLYNRVSIGATVVVKN